MRIKHIKNSSAGAQPISLKSFRDLGHFPNKVALVYKYEHYLPSVLRSWQVIRKWVPLCIVCFFSFLHGSKRACCKRAFLGNHPNNSAVETTIVS